ncbi:hypothetical protein K488DRAFT_64938, partial [Vararia minispora EC-137]
AALFHLLAHPSSPTDTPHRTALHLPHHTALLMPARISPFGTALKLVSVPSAGDGGGLPASTLVLNERSGVLKAVINARALTAARTAAGTVLATTLVHPPSSAAFSRLVIFGAGAQAQSHATLLAATYPSLSDIAFVVRSRASASRLPARTRTLLPGDAAEAAVARADIIVTATPATAPLFDSTGVKRGAHLILVGSWRPDMHEVSSALIKRAQPNGLIVDSREACAREAGELIGAGVRFEGCVEIGELVRGVDSRSGVVEADEERCGRVRGAEVTVVKSVGVGAQDVGIAGVVVAEAEERGVGTLVQNYDAEE